MAIVIPLIAEYCGGYEPEEAALKYKFLRVGDETEAQGLP